MWRRRGTLTEVFVVLNPIVCIASLFLVQVVAHLQARQGGADLESLGIVNGITMVAGTLVLLALAAAVGAKGMERMDFGFFTLVVCALAGLGASSWLDAWIGAAGVAAGPRVKHFWSTWGVLMVVNGALFVVGRVLTSGKPAKNDA